MITSGLKVADADGVHEDDWCWPKVRLRLIAHDAATELRVGVWVPKSPAVGSSSMLSIKVGSMPSTVRLVPYGAPTELSFPVSLSGNEEFGLEITCDNQVPQSEDQRNLSFSLMSLVLL